MSPLAANVFEGKPCRKCGGTRRYRTKHRWGKCIECARDQAGRGRRGLPEPWAVDWSITAETTQPTYEGKPCPRCNLLVKFAKRRGTCVRCHKQWRRDREVSAPRYSNHLHRALGFTRERYYEMCETQSWRCAICQTVPRRGLVLDHCHSSIRFRGLLCHECNSGIGLLGDDPARLRAAIEYLTNA
jgi:hypothetical protein